MTRIAIYARYSSDLQSEASIEDQIRMCEERARREGWKIVNRYTDHGLSGATMMRPGIQKLMQDAQAGKFDLLVAEALDRLSRDQEDIAGIFKRLQFADTGIFTLSEGEISNLHIGLKGTMNALFLKDLADKTRRGLRGRVEAGRSGGGLTYGYDVVKTLDEIGEAKRGEREVNPEQARIVERIFREYAAGQSPKAIAVRLNKEGVTGPSGKGWGPSTIHGNRQRGTGILNNELYIGKLVWNRLRYIKDPETGKRVSRPNPEEDWIIREVPELRIVEQELWDAVKKRQKKIDRKSGPLQKTNRPRHLFSHLLKCGVCGGGYGMISKTHIGCSNARNKGTCDNRLAMKRESLEQAVLLALRDHLLDEELCSAFCESYVAEMNRQRMEHNASIHGYRAEFERVDRELDKLVDAICNGVPALKVKDKIIALENRKAELQNLLETTKEEQTLFHPEMAKRYHEEVQRLIPALNEEEHRTEAAELLRSLIDRITLTPTPERDRLTVDLDGDLAGILSMATNSERSLVERDLSLVKQEKQVVMVAGAGFEPATFRL